MPISFRKLRAVMESRGVKKFDLRKAGVNSQILDKVLSDGNVDTRTIGKLCRLLHCQPGDIMEYDEDQAEQGAAHEEAPKRRDDSYWLTPEGAAELADQPYGRWSTIPGVIKVISEPTPEQKKLAEEINAMRAAGQLLGNDQ